MNKIFALFIFLGYNHFCFSQIASIDSIPKPAHLFFAQTDLFLPIWTHTIAAQKPRASYGYIPVQPHNYTFTAGYFFQGKKKLKKAVQLNVLYFTEPGLLWDSDTYYYDQTSIKFFNISPEIKLLFNKNNVNKGFSLTGGIGYTQIKSYGTSFYDTCFYNNTCNNDTELYEKKHGWNAMLTGGYKLPVKRFYFEFLLGGGTYFVFKRYYYNRYIDKTGEEFYAHEQKYNPDPALKSIEVVNSTTLLYKYKYLGTAVPVFFPRIGINLGFTF